jgi:hypothetical protein
MILQWLPFRRKPKSRKLDAGLKHAGMTTAKKSQSVALLSIAKHFSHHYAHPKNIITGAFSLHFGF